MSNQPHNGYGQREPYEPYEPREPYGPYDQQGVQPPAQPGYDAYQPYDPYAQAQPQQPQSPSAWPTTQGGQQGYAQQEPVTQTWQTPTWDTQTWQQPVAPSAADQGYGASWPGEPAQDGAFASHGRAAAPEADGFGQMPAERPSAQPEARSAASSQVPPAPAAPERPMTAAEKAKAEGRPQILAPGFRPAVLTAVLAGLLAAAAPLGHVALAVPVALLQAVTAAGWFRLNGMWPARQGIALAFLGGLAADIGLLATDADQAPTVLMGTLGVWVLLTLVLQLRSNAAPDERLYGLMVAGASAALTVVAAGHLAATTSDAVVIGAVAVAVTALARALPLPSVASPVVALIAAAGSGVATGQLTGFGTSAALLALAAGVCALAGLRAASYDYPSRFVHMTAGVALPLAAAAPAVYVLGRALG
ncbi:hypothetical protein ACH427_06265 [Streptomyces sp. NPDC020379]|uniref:hypothetical protein n=1 Tax=Streptomyces sp. NPDC020379 TaxID=3365071 RepID=UPI003795EF6C